jgi:hypothetical protein
MVLWTRFQEFKDRKVREKTTYWEFRARLYITARQAADLPLQGKPQAATLYQSALNPNSYPREDPRSLRRPDPLTAPYRPRTTPWVVTTAGCHPKSFSLIGVPANERESKWLPCRCRAPLGAGLDFGVRWYVQTGVDRPQYQLGTRSTDTANSSTSLGQRLHFFS